jgi:hypothetical protein
MHLKSGMRPPWFSAVLLVCGLVQGALSFTVHTRGLVWQPPAMAGTRKGGLVGASMASTAGRVEVPGELELLAADLLGWQGSAIGMKESAAWSHSSRSGDSMVLELTRRIEEEGGKDKASGSLLKARMHMMSILLQHDRSAYTMAATTLGGLIDRYFPLGRAHARRLLVDRVSSTSEQTCIESLCGERLDISMTHEKPSCPNPHTQTFCFCCFAATVT